MKLYIYDRRATVGPCHARQCIMCIPKKNTGHGEEDMHCFAHICSVEVHVLSSVFIDFVATLSVD